MFSVVHFLAKAEVATKSAESHTETVCKVREIQHGHEIPARVGWKLRRSRISRRDEHRNDTQTIAPSTMFVFVSLDISVVFLVPVLKRFAQQTTIKLLDITLLIRYKTFTFPTIINSYKNI